MLTACLSGIILEWKKFCQIRRNVYYNWILRNAYTIILQKNNIIINFSEIVVLSNIEVILDISSLDKESFRNLQNKNVEFNQIKTTKLNKTFFCILVTIFHELDCQSEKTWK